MILYDIVWEDGTQSQEYGDDEADVRQFLFQAYMGKRVLSITPTL